MRLFRGRRRRIGLPAVIVFLLFVLTASFVLLERSVTPTLVAIATKQAHALAVDVIFQAIQEEVARGVEYSDLVNKEVDRDGRVSFMQPNLIEINRVLTHVAIAVQNDLKQMRNLTFGIPLGQILGSQLFAVYGPTVQVGIIPLGTVRVLIDEVFEEAGINQTRHVIHLVVRSDLQVVVPLYKEKIEVETQLPLAEAIIVGPVPSTYLNFNLSSFPFRSFPFGS